MPAWRSDRCRSVSTIVYCWVGEEVYLHELVRARPACQVFNVTAAVSFVSSGPFTGPCDLSTSLFTYFTCLCLSSNWWRLLISL